MCPANAFTGGPEAIHQLAHKLCTAGFNAFIWLYPVEGKPHPEYKYYNARYVESIEDNTTNLLIVPEIWTSFLSGYRCIKKAIWWLSVDNAYVAGKPSEEIFQDRSIIHFSQCKYVESFLKRKTVHQIYSLSDYINQIHFVGDVDFTRRENNILYNPRKGLYITEKLIRHARDLNWVSLKNLSPFELRSLMKRSKVYVDFGHHPGKDRMPREAAINGCCVIVGTSGSAKFVDDVMVPDAYRFDPNILDMDQIISKIRQILSAYEMTISDFAEYRKRIVDEERIFENEIINIFRIDDQ